MPIFQVQKRVKSLTGINQRKFWAVYTGIEGGLSILK